jgi:hypothetical protein
MIPGLPPLRVIARTELTSDTGSVTLSGIDTLVAALPFTARHLVLTINARSTRSAATDTPLIRFNGLGGADYNFQRLTGTGSSPDSARVSDTTWWFLPDIPAASAGAGVFSGGSLIVPHAFNTANHKAGLFVGGAAETSVGANVVRWESNVAISSLLTVPQNGPAYLAGSVFEVAVVDEDYAVEEQLLTADGEFTFSNLDDLVQEGDLVAVGYVRGTASSTNGAFFCRVNGDDDGSHYVRQYIRGVSTTVSAAVTADRRVGRVSCNTAAANAFSPFITSVSAFGKGTNDPHILTYSGHHGSTSVSGIEIDSSRRDDAEAVTSLQFVPESNDFLSGSMMSLYHVPKQLVGYVELESDASSVVFSDIPQNHEDLRVTYYARTDRDADVDSVTSEYNLDTTAANYDRQDLQGISGSASATQSAASSLIGRCPANTETANVFGGGSFLLPQYSKTDRHKHSISISGNPGDETPEFMLNSVRWENTAAITTITLSGNSTNWRAGSIFMLEAIGGIGSETNYIKGDYAVEVDWNNDGKFDGTGEDCTARCTGLNFERGRDSAVTLKSVSPPGKAQVALLNNSGDYSPLNPDSPIAGLVVPNRALRIRQTTPFPEVLWTGTIESYAARQSIDGFHMMDIAAVGALNPPAETTVNAVVSKNKLSGTIFNEILDEAQFSTATGMRVIDDGQNVVGRYTAGLRPALSGLREIEASEQGFITETRKGGIKFEGRHHRLLGKHQLAQSTFADDAGVSDIRYASISPLDPAKAIFNEFKVSVVAYTTGQANATLWKHPEAIAGTSAPLIKHGEKLIFTAPFPNRNSGGTQTQADDATAIGVDNWVPPTATVDYNVFDSSAATGTNLNASMAISTSTFANAAKITIHNTGSIDGYLTKAQLRGTSELVSAPVTMEAVDGISTGTYGLRSFPNSERAKWIQDTEVAQEWCNANLAVWKEPQSFIGFSYSANRNLLSLQSAEKRDLSDRIAVSATGSADLGIVSDYFIEKERHAITADRRHTVAYLVSPVGGHNGFWVMGVSKLGVDTRVYY